MQRTGTILGYDPGGNGSHGVAFFSFEQGRITRHKIDTLQTANDVIDLVCALENLIAIGIDTLTCWSTGPSGWRPADLWLRRRYKSVIQSVASANSLYGSMGINGMAVLMTLRADDPELIITETHPKVFYHALSGEKYSYEANRQAMDSFLSASLGTRIVTHNDHEWDAVASVLAVVNGLDGTWQNDLHTLSVKDGARLIQPCGDTKFWWP